MIIFNVKSNPKSIGPVLSLASQQVSDSLTSSNLPARSNRADLGGHSEMTQSKYTLLDSTGYFFIPTILSFFQDDDETSWGQNAHEQQQRWSHSSVSKIAQTMGHSNTKAQCAEPLTAEENSVRDMYTSERTSSSPVKASYNNKANSSQKTCDTMGHDFNQGTWMSLMSLMDLYEMFVTVDQTTLWARHIAWANKGKDIREYHTKRFSSNMVFLSLLLGSTM